MKASNYAIPEPIRQLAEIADFRLFVTLTPDDLLARSLRKRCAVNEIRIRAGAGAASIRRKPTLEELLADAEWYALAHNMLRGIALRLQRAVQPNYAMA